MTRLRHYDDCDTARFVTFCCYRYLPFLSDPVVIEIFLETLALVRKKHGFKLIGYVVMPEHVHLVLIPCQGQRLGLIVGEIKSRSAIAYFKSCPPFTEVCAKHVFWNRRCFDHNCRSLEVVRTKVHYCHSNPVRRGLVAEPGEWCWSSYNWYHGVRPVPIELDDWRPPSL